MGVLMRVFRIGDYEIMGDDFWLCAEVGNNHQGKVDLCCTLIDRAKKAGAHAVKLQKRDIDTFWSPEQLSMPYDNPNSFGKTYGEHKKVLEFDEQEWRKVVNYAKKADILLFSTAFDVKSVDFLENFDLPAYKVASACHTDYELMQRLVDTKKPLVISVGGGTWEQLDELYDFLKSNNAHFCFLHCVLEYPAPAHHINMRVIQQMRTRYPDTIIGYSDHYTYSSGKSVMSWLAYALGARVFERHFTLNASWPGPDHRLSAEPEEFEAMKHGFERMKVALGTGFKQVYAEELPNIKKMQKWRPNV